MESWNSESVLLNIKYFSFLFLSSSIRCHHHNHHHLFCTLTSHSRWLPWAVFGDCADTILFSKSGTLSVELNWTKKRKHKHKFHTKETNFCFYTQKEATLPSEQLYKSCKRSLSVSRVQHGGALVVCRIDAVLCWRTTCSKTVLRSRCLLSVLLFMLFFVSLQ